MELRQLFSVLLVFALLGAVLVVLKRGGRLSIKGMSSALLKVRVPARTKTFESLERIALTPQHTLHLIRIRGREVVVSTHPTGCGLLTEIQEGSNS